MNPRDVIKWLTIRKRKAFNIFFSVLFVVYLFLQLTQSVLAANMPRLFANMSYQKNTDENLQFNQDDKVIIVGGKYLETMLFIARRHQQQLTYPKKMWNLGGFYTELTISKVDNFNFYVSSNKKLLQKNDLWIRDIQSLPFKPNDIYDLNGITVEVITVQNGNPKKIKVTTAEPLKSYRFFNGKSDSYQEFLLNKNIENL